MCSVKVRVKVRPGGSTREVELEGRPRVRELVKALGYREEEAVVVRGGTVLTEDEALADGDEVEVYEAISGGYG